jgi:hypothetical protein
LFLRKVCLGVFYHSDSINNKGIDDLCVLTENVINNCVKNKLLNHSVFYLNTFNNKYNSSYVKIYKNLMESVLNSDNSVYTFKSININNDYEEFWQNVLLNYT